MERNPYTPPSTEVLIPVTADDSTFLREEISRPIAVWLLTGAILIVVVLLIIKAAQFMRSLFLQGSASGNYLWPALFFALWLAMIGGIALIAVVIHRGVSWSRWIGIALIVAFAAVSLTSPDTTSYTNEAERTGGFVGKVIVAPLLFIWWIYAFAFSAKAKRFFSGKAARGP